jgi:hypothetical protein
MLIMVHGSRQLHTDIKRPLIYVGSIFVFKHDYAWIGLDSVVGIATGYGLNDGGVGVRVPVGSRIFSSPRRPDRL